MKTMRFLAALTAASAFATAAFAAAPVKTVESAKGKVLAGENGMTLYTFKNDKSGESIATTIARKLAAAHGRWQAKAGVHIRSLTRKDGKKQWAKDGMPLYFFVKDAKSGDVAGDGFKGVWNVAKP
ncbi:hypothetical protein [Rhizobium sp. CCGE532]|uniref:COG4315 family predicted lipoprotein n=1 Tax=Rhizobium sp. CCGE532 TaxID=2364272 RepID=UPI000EA8A9FF|nr:hypothetical protein [Rhizobium sp. CCGE532]AYG72992.1 hypothetical protein CCGE532_11265 [Rhizobium sp. CCGE532]